MTRKRKRLYLVLGGLGLLGVATALVLSAFQDNLVFFYGPSDLAAKQVPDGRFLQVQIELKGDNGVSPIVDKVEALWDRP